MVKQKQHPLSRDGEMKLSKSLRTKMDDVLEGPKKPSRRGKQQSPRPLTASEGDRVETVQGQVTCRGGRGGTTN